MVDHVSLAPISGSDAGTVAADDSAPKRLRVDGTLPPRGDGLTKSELNQQLDAYSERTSTNLRALVFGDLGLTWLLILRSSETQSINDRISEYTLYTVAGLCVLALALDVLQYLYAEQAVEDAFDRAERSPTGTAKYDDELFSYRAQRYCYDWKQYFTGFATLLLLVSLGMAVV